MSIQRPRRPVTSGPAASCSRGGWLAAYILLVTSSAFSISAISSSTSARTSISVARAAAASCLACSTSVAKRAAPPCSSSPINSDSASLLWRTVSSKLPAHRPLPALAVGAAPLPAGTGAGASQTPSQPASQSRIAPRVMASMPTRRRVSSGTSSSPGP